MEKAKIFIGIQCRLASTRFPNKAFADILGVPLIIRVIQRMLTLEYPNDLAILCPQQEQQQFEQFFSSYNISIPILTGDMDDVLSRYYIHAKNYQHPLVMRVTGDNPLISIPLAEMLIQHHLKFQPDLSHYMQNPLGTGVEIISLNALEKTFHQSSTKEHKEHVTQYIYQNPQQFNILEPISPFILSQFTQLSVDYPKDIELIESLLSSNSQWDISLF